VILVFIISSQPLYELNYLDNPWYLNRARLIWQGVMPDLFVYTLAYPALVGLIDFLTRDAILAGMLANTLVLVAMLVGIRTLGWKLFHSRKIAWLAILLVVTNTSTLTTLRLFWANAPFMTLIIWDVIVYLAVVEHPGTRNSLLLGLILAATLYTRFEGVVYAFAIPLAAWMVYRRTGNFRQGVQVLGIAGLLFGILILPYIVNFVQIRQHIDAALSVIWRRVTDMMTALLYHWRLAAWLLGIAGLVWSSPENRRARWICAALIGLNFVYAFALTIWPSAIHIVYTVPFFALILAATLDQVSRHLGQWKQFTVLVMLVVALPGLGLLSIFATTDPPFAYRALDMAHTAKSMDDWLVQQGWFGKRIYAFCNEIVSFSRANFQIMYRLQFTTGWDSPERLIPQMREQSDLLMICEDQIGFTDWRAWFAESHPTGLVKAGQFDRYVFYRPGDS
jgi:hypothetical protein